MANSFVNFFVAVRVLRGAGDPSASPEDDVKKAAKGGLTVTPGA